MATYLYETTDPSRPIRQFEVQQSMNDQPLESDPETGEPIRRVITGGFGYASRGKATPPSTGGCCVTGCGCH